MLQFIRMILSRVIELTFREYDITYNKYYNGIITFAMCDCTFTKVKKLESEMS